LQKIVNKHEKDKFYANMVQTPVFTIAVVNVPSWKLNFARFFFRELG